jgi:flagellar motor protein MotB
MAMTLQTILLTVAFIVLWALPATAEQALPEDRAVIAACLAAVAENITRQGPGDLSDEAPGIAGRLAAAARDSQRKASSCIGAVLVPCFQKPDVLSTAAMLECSSRELEVWDEQLNAAYKAALAEASPATEKALREAQRLLDALSHYWPIAGNQLLSACRGGADVRTNSRSRNT